jgi:hypothetical protein
LIINKSPKKEIKENKIPNFIWKYPSNWINANQKASNYSFKKVIIFIRKIEFVGFGFHYIFIDYKIVNF